MFQIRPFYTPNVCQIAFGVVTCVCDNDACGKVHGYAFHVQLFCWGIEIEYLFNA